MAALPQPVTPPNLPQPPRELAAAIHEILDEYYDGWRGSGRTVPTPCEVDRGDVCRGRDPDGGCNRGTCRSEQEMLAFVDRLATLARAYPDEPEPFAHALYSAVKMELMDRAWALAEHCPSRQPWLCELAAGVALHRGGRSGDSEPRFRRALVSMPAPLRCSFEDVRALLPDDSREQYDAIPCEHRDRAHRWFWWASDPFLVDHGNDRWTEHLVRGFETMMHQRFRERTRSRALMRTWDYPAYWAYRVRRGRSDSFDGRWYSLGPGRGTGFVWTSRKAAFNHFVPEVVSFDSLRDDLHYRLRADVEKMSALPSPGDEGYTRPRGPVFPVHLRR